MTSDDAPPATRRALRAQTGAQDLSFASDPAPAVPPSTVALLEADAPPPVSPAPADPGARVPRSKGVRPSRTALAWVDETTVTAANPVVGGGVAPASVASADAASATASADFAVASAPYVPVQPDLLARRPRRSPLRPGVILPILVVFLVMGAYAATTLLWPLYAVPPVVTAAPVQPATAPLAAPAWPTAGSAAVSVQGIDGVPATTADASSIASITKLVTSLMVLEEQPLALGEQGPEYKFTSADRSSYRAYVNRGESALDVPVGGTLTEYQMLQGVLIGSANNYADRLASTLWPTDAVFANAAAAWLSTHGVPGVTIVDPSGIDEDNAADPASLVTLARKALAHPVIAEIVRTPAVELPGAGLVENTNEMLADPGVVGIKTGSLFQFANLLAAKDLVIGSTPVRMYASVLGQPDDDARFAAARALFAQLEAELQLVPSVTAGTPAGVVTTPWGERVDALTSADASVVLWNGATGAVTIDFALDEQRTADDTIGTLTVDGPLDSQTVDVHLAADIEDPTAWWRLTHPLELFGLAG